MTAVTGQYRACGKFILCGEHFVVHGTPAVALPFRSIGTQVTVFAANQLSLQTDLDDPAARTLAVRVAHGALERLGLQATWRIEVQSNIPVGFGLGSSAAFGTAVVGALARATGQGLTPAQLNEHAYALETIVHGQPSGIDNTVIAHETAVRFVRGEPFRTVTTAGALTFVLASCGYPGSTMEAVAQVGHLAAARPSHFGELLSEAHTLVEAAVGAFEAGDAATLGPLLSRNHQLLASVGVSTPELEKLVEAAHAGGALGAKLTGGGQGGFVLALVDEAASRAVAAAMSGAGATDVFTTEVTA